MKNEKYKLNRLTEIEFFGFCEEGKCLRYVQINKHCQKISKRNRCYKKYLFSVQRKEIKLNMVDEKWVECKEKIKELDTDRCKLWECLTTSEKKFLLSNYFCEYTELSKILDPAHIVPKSEDLELKYDVNNVITISRYFHTLLDSYLDPIYRTKITKEERIQWFERARKMRKED